MQLSKNLNVTNDKMSNKGEERVKAESLHFYRRLGFLLFLNAKRSVTLFLCQTFESQNAKKPADLGKKIYREKQFFTLWHNVVKNYSTLFISHPATFI